MWTNVKLKNDFYKKMLSLTIFCMSLTQKDAFEGKQCHSNIEI